MTNTKNKKLYRSKTNRMIGGVCGGLGEYFDVDPTIIRLLWVVIFFMGGSGILIYIIFWIVLPEEDEVKEVKNDKKEAK